ncbi:acyl-CoA thioesterase [Neobacillus cucumis]|uniref:acyl-CoA thioesterase n=1 Tax=Neobacillus cucumis TaxID=1740721 RepID=UPI0028531227|nr:thioesterase family protein [Neobacillus cucumis]MDR4946789.1 thioesterase family protein [Neobacillus cucumis]
MKSEFSFQVRWGDTDAAGIVFYPNFYKWMDDATHNYLAIIGYPSSKLFAEHQIGVPLLEANCMFKRPLLFEDQVVVESFVEELRNKVFKIKHEFKKEGQMVAEGYEVRAWTSFAGKPKAQPIPNYIRELMVSQVEILEG